MQSVIKLMGIVAGIFALMFMGSLFMLHDDQLPVGGWGAGDAMIAKKEHVSSSTAKLPPIPAAVTLPLSSPTTLSVSNTPKSVTPQKVETKIAATKTKVTVSTPGPLYVGKPPVVSVATATPAATSSDLGVPSTDGALNQNAILLLVNAERAKAALKPLVFNKRLADMAEAKANDMITKQYFAHVAPDGTDVVKLAERYEYHYLNIGENLAMGDFISSSDVMDGWMNSPGHRANILNKNYTEIGISAIEGNYEGRMVWYAVQEFGKPEADCSLPDPQLAQEITDEEATISGIEVTLTALRDTMSDPNIDRNSYNVKAQEYNTIVSTYNDLVATTKADIATHNVDVDAYNSCVAAP